MTTRRIFPYFAFLIFGILAGVLLFHTSVASALPEYAERTGQPCSTCHINPAGGGPRTERGMLWVASGKPDVVPELPSQPQPEQPSAPSGDTGDAATLFTNLQCAACHAADGSGLVGPPLNTGELSPETISEVVRNGRGAMPAFGVIQLSDEQLGQMAAFIQGLGAAPANAPVETLSCGQ